MGNFSLSSVYIPAPLNPEIIFEGIHLLCQSKSMNMLLGIKCPSVINSSGLSVTCCQNKSNHTANILVVIEPPSETVQNVLGKAFDPFLVL